jgi:hypothetical protein
MAKAAVATGLGIAGGAFPPLLIVSAIIAAHAAISSTVAANVTNEMNGYVKRGMEGYAAELAALPAVEAAKKTAASRSAQRSSRGGAQMQRSPLSDIPPWKWAAGGLMVLVGGYLLLRE